MSLSLLPPNQGSEDILLLPDEKLCAGETGVSPVLPSHVLQLDSSTDDRQTSESSAQDQGVLMSVIQGAPGASQLKGMSTTSSIL